MRLFDLALLADENIHPEVVRGLVEREANVLSVAQTALNGAGDVSILARARAQERVVLTHDRDFGTLAIRAGEPFFGIVYLRPGDISPARVLAMLEAHPNRGGRVDSALPGGSPPSKEHRSYPRASLHALITKGRGRASARGWFLMLACTGSTKSEVPHRSATVPDG